NVHVLYSIHADNSSVPQGTGSIDKRLRVLSTALERLQTVRGELSLRAADRRAWDRMMARHYFWSIGYAILWAHDRKREALVMFCKGLRLDPWNLRSWKTYLLARFRLAVAARSPAVSPEAHTP